MFDWRLERLPSEVRVESLRFLHVITDLAPHALRLAPSGMIDIHLQRRKCIGNCFPQIKKSCGRLNKRSASNDLESLMRECAPLSRVW